MAGNELRNKVEDLVIGLARVKQLGQMYGPGHKMVKETMASVYDALAGMLSEKEEIIVGIIGNEIAYEKEPFYEASMRIADFIEHLKEIGVKKIIFSRGVDAKEFAEFSRILAMKASDLIKEGGAQKFSEAAGVVHIKTGEIGLAEGSGEAGEKQMIDDLTKGNYDKGLDFLEKTYGDIKGNRKLNVQSARQIVSGMISDMLRNKNLLMVLTSVRGQGEGMFLHAMNVAVFTLAQAESLGLDKSQMVDVGMAALLHDVGKLSLPEDNGDEDQDDTSEDSIKRRAMQDVQGAKILLETEGIGTLAALVAYEHNMKYDMSGGGPKRLYGEDLNLISMMIAISSYYDRLRRKPSYKLEGGPEKAYEDMMKLAGKDFQPDLLNNFFSLVGVYPPGTLVALDTGEIALVIQSSMMDKKRPQVEILYDQKGEKYGEPRLVNLLEKDERGRFKWTIVKSVSPMDKFEIPEKYS